jgi:hypothetical protein
MRLKIYKLMKLFGNASPYTCDIIIQPIRLIEFEDTKGVIRIRKSQDKQWIL